MGNIRRSVIALMLAASCHRGSQPIVVGSKNFTESVLLGEIIVQRLEKAGCSVQRKLDLGGTLVCDRAITTGGIDVYPEYSGTALTAILHRPASRDRQAVMKQVQADYARRQLHWGPPLGFQNTFAMIVRRNTTLKRISDLRTVEKTF